MFENKPKWTTRKCHNTVVQYENSYDLVQKWTKNTASNIPSIHLKSTQNQGQWMGRGMGKQVSSVQCCVGLHFVECLVSTWEVLHQPRTYLSLSLPGFCCTDHSWDQVNWSLWKESKSLHPCWSNQMSISTQFPSCTLNLPGVASMPCHLRLHLGSNWTAWL